MTVINLIVNGERVSVDVLERSRERVRFQLAERTYEVAFESETPRTEAAVVSRAQQSPQIQRGEGVVVAPIPGVVVDVRVKVGEVVSSGQVLLVLEAMKMQNNLLAPRDGKVIEVGVSVGAEVNDGQPLVKIE